MTDPEAAQRVCGALEMMLMRTATSTTDILELLGSWGSSDPDKDIDGSGTVDFGDLVGALANWGPC